VKDLVKVITRRVVDGNAGTPDAIKPVTRSKRVLQHFPPPPEEYASIMAIHSKIRLLYILEATIQGFPVIYGFTERRRGRAEGI
jgi:hypothetical protein